MMIHSTFIVVCLLLLTTCSQQSFVLYPWRDLASFAVERGVTTACMQAMLVVRILRDEEA